MNSMYSDTIVAPATTPGTGAISIVRVSGPDCFKVVDAVIKLKSGNLSSAAAYTINYGEVLEADGSVLDQVLVSVFRAPHSYTGEDSAEISAHASSYIASELVRLLIAAGARFAEPGEFTRRAFLNGKMDLAQAEAVADVISSTTSASHRVAMNQLKGGFSQELAGLRTELLDTASLLELELDFSEEDVEFADRKRLGELLDTALEHVNRLSASFKQGNMIKNGVPVAIVGAANAGKSTLLNSLLGEDRAIVSDIAGTTRDTIEEALNLGGILFRFIDTAGIRESSDTIEKIGIDRAFQKLSLAEIVLALVDPSADILDQVKLLSDKVDPTTQKLFFLLNKADLLSQNDINKFVTILNNSVSHADIKCNIVKVSAKSGIGLEELKKQLVESEKDLIPNSDSVFVTNARHYQALQEASASLTRCRASLDKGLPTELLSEDLRSSISSVNTILGTSLLDPETILHSIFSKHCIG
ncbi:MAG: tRNA uridine-5-carboxymethylaminomethyl(34) synthesis GTPase MnmE, partial [Bacteroidales bacterium]|nr:tRNA uridine-5-carboxymethylaminomethyl(34) synthesis GTPase MnmE [Bacteroidales bacterium]